MITLFTFHAHIKIKMQFCNQVNATTTTTKTKKTSHQTFILNFLFSCILHFIFNFIAFLNSKLLLHIYTYIRYCTLVKNAYRSAKRKKNIKMFVDKQCTWKNGKTMLRIVILNGIQK